MKKLIILVVILLSSCASLPKGSFERETRKSERIDRVNGIAKTVAFYSFVGFGTIIIITQQRGD